MSKHVLNARLGAPLKGVVNASGGSQSQLGVSAPPPVRPGLRLACAAMSTLRTQPDEPLEAAARDQTDDEASDAAARLRELYRQHASRLVRQLARQSGCQELGRELANETFVRLLRMPPASLAQIRNPEAFLRRIATNLLLDWARAKQLRDRSRSTLEILPDPFVDQVAALESRDMLRRLERAVAELKPRTREIFLAHRIRGLTYAEIALLTGLSVKGVEKQLAKAITTIARSLE